MCTKLNVKSQCAMAQRCIQHCCPLSKAEWQGAGRNRRLSVPSAWSWKVTPVKQHVWFQVSRFQNNHRHRSSKKSNRRYQCLEGPATDEGLRMYHFTEGAVRLRKPIPPREECKHHEGGKLFTKCGVIQWFRKPCSITGPTEQNHFSASYTLTPSFAFCRR